MADTTLEHDDMTQNTIVDFDAGDGETAAAVKMETYSSNLNVAKQKSVRLVDAITGAPLKRKDAIRVDDLRPALAEYIRSQHPTITSDDYVSRRAMDDLRGRYIAELLKDDGVMVLHAIGRYVPHFIALAASSPYVQGVDTGFASARLNSVAAFPMSGRAPHVLTWDAFKAYFDKMHATGVIESMKDFYWDIRPKPEFGTIEVRVMDTPLTVQRACDIAAYIQALARYLLLSRPFMPQEDDYLVYTFNRFQACRFGLEGEYVHPNELTRMPIADHILSICDALEPHAEALGSLQALANIRAQAASRDNDAHWVRTVNGEAHSLRDTVRRTCEQWEA